ncbi:hypothetical protein I862_07260 [endosymbiont of Acanthamoeba sp. UWC8]|uniref:hypothetical protein n=1 Tax=endosymbiont of Acanthamoeba sp. UWC8 TaxID=86106 RepID=UPI0004D1B0D8|nr:hypothetical protein [endosymbiont of Acanthamoeba sp. UWC8]AIF82006.1 hypothetical protein I862_07260 [endosymbiont of Acanthamoeba sp. UWC8]
MSLSIFNFKVLIKERIFLTMLLTVIVVSNIALINIYFLNGDLQNKELEDRFWLSKIYQGKKKYDIIIAGDSRIYRGISPRIMQPILPSYRIFNYGFSGGGLNSYIFNKLVFLLNKDSSHSKIIILGVTPHSLTPKAQKNEHIKQYEMISNKDKENILNKSFWYSYIRPLNLSRIKNKFTNKHKLSNYIQHYDIETGWIGSDYRKRDNKAAIPAYQSVFINNQVAEQNILALSKQIRQWTQQGIIIIGFRPPTSQAVYNIENQMSRYDESKIRKEFEKAGAYWLCFDINNYETYDGNHLVESSAIILSKELSYKIKSILLNKRGTLLK